jgi:hypothetical protein
VDIATGCLSFIYEPDIGDQDRVFAVSKADFTAIGLLTGKLFQQAGMPVGPGATPMDRLGKVD